MKCKHHPDRDASGMVQIASVPVCDECAQMEVECGLLVIPVPEDDGILDAQVIDA